MKGDVSWYRTGKGDHPLLVQTSVFELWHHDTHIKLQKLNVIYAILNLRHASVRHFDAMRAALIEYGQILVVVNMLYTELKPAAG